MSAVSFAAELQPDRAAWRRRLTTLSMVCMETLALFILGELLVGPYHRFGPSLLTLLAAAFAGNALVRLLQHFELPRRVLVSAGVCVAMLGLLLLGSIEYGGGSIGLGELRLLLTDPVKALDGHMAQVFGIAIMTLALVRGSLVAMRARLTQRAVLSSLTVALGIVFLGLTIGRGDVAEGAIDNAALPVFVAGLLTLALLQLGQSEHIQGDSWRGPWLLVLLGSSIVLALAGAAVGLLPLGILAPALAVSGSFALDVLDLLLFIVVYPMALVINWLLLHLLAPHMHQTNFQIQTPTYNPQQLRHQAHRTSAGILVAEIGHILLIVVAIGLIVFVLLWLFKRLGREATAEDQQRERVEGEGALRSDLQDLLSSLLRRLRRPAAASEPDHLSPRLLELRRLYLSVLRRSEARGLPRPPATTPREFAPALEQHFASALPGELTEQFTRGRYGLLEPDAAELERLKHEAGRVH